MKTPPPMAKAVPVITMPLDTPLQQTKGSLQLPLKDAADINELQVQQLMEQGFTRGLAQSLAANNLQFQYRIWVVDNSGSMNHSDGKRILDTVDTKLVRIVRSTRWEEIKECVKYHIKMAKLLDAPTTFRLLNDPGKIVGPQQFSIAETPGQDEHEAIVVMDMVRPGGATPLAQHIREIHQSITMMLDSLRESGRRVAVVIATDGLPSDYHGVSGRLQQREFVDSLRLLEGLPVWVVVRLCTDDDEVVGFYNDLDEQLEMSLEVLDDFCGEAAEVYRHNSWLNYALPLHRCREMGYHHRVFDMLDERKLTTGELREFCELLFGADKFDGVPDPDLDWEGFSRRIGGMVGEDKMQWNPMSKTATPWIDVKKLDCMYGGAHESSGSSSSSGSFNSFVCFGCFFA